jgi:hypothetical protein
MATVDSVTMTAPSSDPNINVGGSFAMEGNITKALHGALDYDFYWQWDQGIATWVDIGTDTGLGLYHAGTNPLTAQIDEATKSLTIFGGSAGTYSVRCRTVDHNDGDATDDSGTQTVTVSAATGTRRIALIS